MDSANDVLLLILLIFGHAALWVAMFNRVHALPLPCRVINGLEKVHVLILVAGPLAGAAWLLGGQGAEYRLLELLSRLPWLAGYSLICAGMAVFIPVIWLLRNVKGSRFSQPISNHTRCLDVEREIGHSLIGTRSAYILSKIPGNQLCELYVHDKILAHPDLPRLWMD